LIVDRILTRAYPLPYEELGEVGVIPDINLCEAKHEILYRFFQLVSATVAQAWRRNGHNTARSFGHHASLCTGRPATEAGEG
jgi:hypothetical protein